MKKFIIAFAVVFVINLGCKKIIEQPVCACSPASYPSFNLAIKNADGDDLLNPATANSFDKDQIQLFKKEANGSVKQIVFFIRPPFNYGNTNINYHQIISDDITRLWNNASDSFYLKLGSGLTYELNLQLNNTNRKVEKLLVDKKEAPIETAAGINAVVNIFKLSVI